MKEEAQRQRHKDKKAGIKLQRHKVKQAGQKGFTIMEAVIACVIFVSIFVPLMAFLYKDSNFIRDRDKVTALCLLDQEAKTLQVFPQLYAPVKKKEIKSAEWQIKTDKQGKDLFLFKIGAYKRDKLVQEVVFRAYKKN